MNEPVIWSGQKLASDTLAVLIPPDPVWHLEVHGEESGCWVLEKQIAVFLAAHADALFVCENAVDLHLGLLRAVDPNGTTESGDVVWRLSDEGRVFDLSLLEQLLKSALGGAPVQASPDLSGSPRRLLTYYRTLANEAEQVIRDAGVDT